MGLAHPKEHEQRLVVWDPAQLSRLLDQVGATQTGAVDAWLN